MISLVEEKRAELGRLCAQYHVRRLELFGSAADERFDPERSDLDFLVEFEDLAWNEYAQHYFGLADALVDLFGRPVDLVMLAAVDNPYFLEEIESSRRLLYAA
jgi:hypothetical protein